MPAYKDNKTGKWFCKFYYTDWQGNNRQKWKRGFATKKEALAYERDFLEKQSANPDMTFQNLYELYMEDMTDQGFRCEKMAESVDEFPKRIFKNVSENHQ